MDAAVEPVEKKVRSQPEAPVVDLPRKAYVLRDCETVNDVASDLTCTICLGVLSDPVQCNGGGHMYCRECITPIANQANGRCPVGGQSCKQIVPSTLLVVPAVVRNILNAIVIKCPQKCDEWTGAFETLNQHLLLCTRRQVQCGWCKTNMELNSMQVHDDECKKRIVKCDYCKRGVTWECLDSHVTMSCKLNPYRTVQCICGVTVPSTEHENHMLSDAANHFVLQKLHIKLLSTFLFGWTFSFNDKRISHESDAFYFAGISWYLMTSNQGGDTVGIYLCSRDIGRYTQLVTRCITFFIYRSGYHACNAGFENVYYRSNGSTSLKNGGEWVKQGLGKTGMCTTELNVEYRFSCRINIIN
jgi:hypothetical protein